MKLSNSKVIRPFAAWLLVFVLVIGVQPPRFMTVRAYVHNPPQYVVRLLFHGCDVQNIVPQGDEYTLLMRCHVLDGFRRRAVTVRPTALLDVTTAEAPTG